MQHISRKILGLTALVLTLGAAASAQQPARALSADALKKELQTKLDEWHAAGKFPGATLGVVLPNGKSLGLATGYSDRDAKTPMKPTDRMPAGSTGKTFAAALAMQLN
jgi:CubicO group peptidase (beta-lactamase class C family)